MISLDNLEKNDYVSARGEFLLPLQTVLDDIPALILTGEETARIRNGQSVDFISKPNFERLEKSGLDDQQTALALYDDNAVALIERDKASVKPVRVFNLSN